MEFRVFIVSIAVLALIVGASGEVGAQSHGGSAKTSVSLRIDASAAVLSAELMSHIRTVNEGFFDAEVDAVPAKVVADRVSRNRQDPKLSEIIDSLLALPVYVELSRVMRTFAPEKLEGRSAYREALYRLPWMRTRLMGDVDGQYLQLLRKSDPTGRKWLMDLTERLRAEEFTVGVLRRVTDWLPPSVIEGFGDTVDVYLYFDGNRGCFQRDGSIYIDLMQFALADSASDSACVVTIGCTMAHELHHVIYGNWLAEFPKGADVDSSWRDQTLNEWRNAVLTEGSARFCDWENLPECAQRMALDARLGEEIFATWESVFLRLSDGEIPESEYLAMRSSFNHDRALRWFKQYLTAHYAPSTARELLKKYPAYRPVPHYYVGYRIFNEILETGGKSAFFYAMLHPDEVLDIYYDIAAGDERAPKVSKETVARWAGP